MVDIENFKAMFVCERKDSSTLTKFNEDLINHGGKPTTLNQLVMICLLHLEMEFRGIARCKDYF